MREAHQVGLIHRDIKPGNVFAAQRGGLYDVVKLLDFGLVKPVGENASARLSQEGGISGTPLFMSPEQARGLDDLDARSDIYSLGAVAYALLTGRPPFDGTNRDGSDHRPRPRRSGTAVGASGRRAGRSRTRRFSAVWPRDPEDRFQDVESLEAALAECAAAGQWTQWHAARWWLENNEKVERPRSVGMAAIA